MTAKAYSLNVTAVPHGSLGFLTAWPRGESQPVVSTLDASTEAVNANAAIVLAGTGGEVSIFVSDASDVILDIDGCFAPPASGGLSLYTVAQCRAIDTRNGAGAFDGTLIMPIHSSSYAPPATAQAYVLNATVVPTASLSLLSLWAAGKAQPVVSRLNANDGTVTSNMAILPTTNGSVDAFASDSTNLILGIASHFAPRVQDSPLNARVFGISQRSPFRNGMNQTFVRCEQEVRFWPRSALPVEHLVYWVTTTPRVAHLLHMQKRHRS